MTDLCVPLYCKWLQWWWLSYITTKIPAPPSSVPTSLHDLGCRSGLQPVPSVSLISVNALFFNIPVLNLHLPCSELPAGVILSTLHAAGLNVPAECCITVLQDCLRTVLVRDGHRFPAFRQCSRHQLMGVDSPCASLYLTACDRAALELLMTRGQIILDWLNCSAGRNSACK